MEKGVLDCSPIGNLGIFWLTEESKNSGFLHRSLDWRKAIEDRNGVALSENELTKKNRQIPAYICKRCYCGYFDYRCHVEEEEREPNHPAFDVTEDEFW